MYPSTGNSTWCEECNHHIAECTCDPVQNIYLITYRIEICYDVFPCYHIGKVRCIAYDPYLAMSKINNWALNTEKIWDKDNILHKVPKGKRSVSILSVDVYASNVGKLLELEPLPEIFPHEE